jgi:tRNA threonylcarbamoyl adenosine modification protein YeaZ
MNILSIDTSASSFSLTLVKDGENITYVDSSDHISSETILVEINNLVTNCELNPKDINTVIYNNGPGSFTGVRVSSAIVQAIGFSNNCPVYGINALMLTAYSCFKKTNQSQIQVIKKAFGDKVFHGLFHLTNNSCTSKESITTTNVSDVVIDQNYILLSDVKIILDEHKEDCLFICDFIGSELLIEYYDSYCSKKNKFDYKDALPSYAGHTI